MNSAKSRERHEEIQRLQRRLGTPAECPGDFERILALAHQISNEITVEILRSGVRLSAASCLRTFRAWLRG